MDTKTIKKGDALLRVTTSNDKDTTENVVVVGLGPSFITVEFPEATWKSRVKFHRSDLREDVNFGMGSTLMTREDYEKLLDSRTARVVLKGFGVELTYGGSVEKTLAIYNALRPLIEKGK